MPIAAPGAGSGLSDREAHRQGRARPGHGSREPAQAQLHHARADAAHHPCRAHLRQRRVRGPARACLRDRRCRGVRGAAARFGARGQAARAGSCALHRGLFGRQRGACPADAGRGRRSHHPHRHAVERAGPSYRLRPACQRGAWHRPRQGQGHPGRHRRDRLRRGHRGSRSIPVGGTAVKTGGDRLAEFIRKLAARSWKPPLPTSSCSRTARASPAPTGRFPSARSRRRRPNRWT